MDYENKAIRLESATSLGKNKSRLVIYWGSKKAYDKNWKAVERTLNSIKLKKMP